MKVLYVIAALICVDFCESARILGVFNHPGGSHTYIGKVLLRTLAQKGHEVVMISSFPFKENVKNYRDINLPENLEDLKRRSKMYFTKNKRSELEETRNMSLTHTENTFRNKDVQTLLESDARFDVVIVDWFFNEATLIFGWLYKAPVIYISSFGNMALLSESTGNSLPFSYVPGAGLIMSDNMSLKHRVIMTAVNILFTFVYAPRRNNEHHELLKKYFDSPPSIKELQGNVALVLSNSHFSFETARPYTPNIIPVGGFHIQDLEDLPQELEEWLDASVDGVVYFSLGSQIRSTDLNNNLTESIITALSKVAQRVLWKCEDELSDLPPNIRTAKWAPQREVLAHPNVKLFITHGGVLSVIESIYFQVPILSLPFNGDQNTNAAFVETRGLGLKLIPEEVTATTFYNATLEILSNPRYKEEMTYRSLLLREQPMKPIDTAVFWVEHVIKHGHGRHLKPFSTKLHWIKYYCLDIIGLVGVVLFMFFSALVVILKIFYYCAHKLVSAKRKTD